MQNVPAYMEGCAMEVDRVTREQLVPFVQEGGAQIVTTTQTRIVPLLVEGGAHVTAAATAVADCAPELLGNARTAATAAATAAATHAHVAAEHAWMVGEAAAHCIGAGATVVRQEWQDLMATAPSPAARTAALAQLTAMGFYGERASAALQLHNYNVAAAVTTLLA